MEDPYSSPRVPSEPVMPVPPVLPRGPLWLLLVSPPVLMIGVNLVIGWSGSEGEYGEGFLLTLPAGLLALIVCQVFFSRFIRQRFRGKSLVLLSLGYFIGEFVIGLAVWFGSCLLFSA